MPRRKFASPTLDLAITPEQHERAVKSDSGGCLIADAIKEQYPHLTGVVVDMATIRVTDKKAGERYTYLTPAPAQHVLLAFDQGWPNPTDRLVVKRAVKITPVVRGVRDSPAAVAARRETHIAELEGKIAAGEQLTDGEKQALGRMKNAKPTRERPTARGRSVVSSGNGRDVVVRGGRPLVQGPAHPNLLRSRGRARHFGAQLADPGVAFREAVDAAVAERLAEEQTGA
jgi:hypothetical protein